jgi:hypothetical protein
MSDTESDRDSLESINGFDNQDESVNEEELTKVKKVREAVQSWKTKEMDKNTIHPSNSKGLGALRNYVAKSARLYYDLNTYLTTEKNTESNLNDKYYVNIITAIGIPGGLSYHLKELLQSLFERDLVELPFTLEPKVINSYAKKGERVNTEFPEEE